MSRYAPTLDLWSGSHNLTADCLDLTIDQAITHKSPSINFTLDNRKERWSNAIELGLKYVPVTCAVNGTDFFKGRLDLTVKDISKRGGNILVCAGRGDFGALEDITSSLQFVNQYPHDIVIAIIAEYNARKQGNDPTLTIQRNDAPKQGSSNAVLMSFQWKRMSLQRMLYQLQQALGAPVAQGGVATYYDFYVDTSDDFYFDEVGKYPDAGSRVTIPANSETMKAKRICDMNPFRSELWVWGSGAAGAIPLTMQLGYNTNKFSPPHTPDPDDPWSNDNTSDFQHDNFTTVSYDTTTILPTGYALKFSQAAQPAQAPGWLHQGYWIMPFPFGSVGTDHYWPTTLNCYNETTMIETMGEITGLDFWLEGDHDFDIYIEAKDSQSTPVTGRSDTTYHYPTTDRADLDYCEYSIPFGPSSNFIVPTTSTLDWSSIQQIKFHFINGPDKYSTMYIHFDAFKMVKPLVAVATDYGAGLCTSDISNQTTITDFKTAQAIAYGLLQNENTPQIYWDFENLGRTDIMAGHTFAVSGTPPLLLLMRELKLTMSKRQGFKITGKGYEAV